MITVQRTLQQPYHRIAIVHNRDRVAVYNITDSSLARTEQLTIQKTTRQFTSLSGMLVVENTYMMPR